MHFDALTLMAAGIFANAVSGVLLVAAWTQIRDAPALVWWAAANFTYSAGLLLLLIGLPGGLFPLILAGQLISSLCPALIWGGARRFAGGKAPLALLVAGTLALIVTGAALGSAAAEAVAAVGFAAWVAYLLAAIWELWRSRGEVLPARWPLLALFVLHAVVYIGGVEDVMSGNLRAGDGVPPIDSWFGVIYFEGLLYAMGTAIFMIVLCKERSELHLKRAAHVDALTGAANRGVFLESAARILQRSQASGSPLSLIFFDLDRFKSINDTFGHRVGDQVLLTFADTARQVLRPNDLFGRHGGEEFAVMLPGTTIETAYVIAERIRRAFIAACSDLEAGRLGTTVSAGVAAAAPGTTVDQLLTLADGALYRAKRLGRNRVERAGDGKDDRGGGSVVRVA